LATAAAFLTLIAGCTSATTPNQTDLSAEPTETTSAMNNQTTTPDDAATDDPAAVVLIDEKTAVFPSGTDRRQDGSPASSLTPSEEAVDAAIQTLANTSELAWAVSHTRFITGYSLDNGTERLRVDLSCDAGPLTSTDEAREGLRRVAATDGGGDCYGYAMFDSAGNLDTWGVNGSS